MTLSTIETIAMMIDAQIAVQKKLSIVSRSVSASVIWSEHRIDDEQEQPERHDRQREGEEPQERADHRVHDSEDRRDQDVAPRSAGDVHAGEQPAGHRERECEQGPADQYPDDHVRHHTTAFGDPERVSLGAERDLDRRAASRTGADRRGAGDARRALPDVAQPLARAAGLFLEAGAVVRDRDHPATVAMPDADDRGSRVRVLPHVREPFLDDPEDLDLLVGREVHTLVDLDVDLEQAVCGQELDVAPERCVERRASTRRRQRQHCEACFLLGRDRELLDAGDRLVGDLSALEHARVRRECEEVLRETVVDVAGDASAFVGDRAPELGRADRPPDADEQHAEGDHAQEVADGDRGRGGERGEDAVERGEEAERAPPTRATG